MPIGIAHAHIGSSDIIDDAIDDVSDDNKILDGPLALDWFYPGR